jgi:hypothetical protein
MIFEKKIREQNILQTAELMASLSLGYYKKVPGARHTFPHGFPL